MLYINLTYVSANSCSETCWKGRRNHLITDVMITIYSGEYNHDGLHMEGPTNLLSGQVQQSK